MDRYEEDIQKLKACPFENAYVDSGRITGDITTQKPRLLQFSVPYSEGFSATIDGEKAEVLRSDVMYTAVQVPAGTHHIELRYRTPYLGVGLIVSILTAGGMILYAVIRRIKKRKKGRTGA